jgi:hypothetical protein
MTLLTDDDWEDPFAQLETHIKTPEDAGRWVHFVDSLRKFALWPARDLVDGWDQDLQDPQLVNVLRSVREAAENPQTLAAAVCCIDLWTSRMRLEWGLGWAVAPSAAIIEYDRKRLDEQCAAAAALKAATSPECHKLVGRLSDCAGAAEAAAEDRVLRIAGIQLTLLGLGELFETIYSSVIDGAEPGDGLRFVQAVSQP